MSKILYIDPQSYNNLSLYDRGLMCKMNPKDTVMFCSTKWDCGLPNADLNKVFSYNDIKNPLLKGFSYLKSLHTILRYIKNHPEIRVVHIQWLRFWEVDYLFAKWLIKRGIKVVFTAHNILPHNSGEKYRNKYQKYYELINLICVHTETTKKELVQKFKIDSSKIIVIPHGIIEPEIIEEELNSRIFEIKNNLNIQDDILILSSLGLQSHYKGVDTIIDIWANEPELFANNKIKLMLIGKNTGIDYSPIKDITNVIIIDKRVSNIDFKAYLTISDIILLPYRQISQSGVLFSALASNKPVLVSKIGGIAEPLAIAEVGYNMGEMTKENLKKSLLRIVHDAETIKEWPKRRNEFNKVKEYYSWESISSKLKQVYDSLTTNLH